MTADLILHHYPTSPFSEKVRLVLGYKELAWRSVHIPVIMPKPDVVALTGGYRRTPLLQQGADVYCDSALICEVLEALAPDPPLWPASATGTADMLAAWADSQLFWTAVPYAMQPAGVATVFGNAPLEVIKAFAVDRAAFAPQVRRPTPADAAAALHRQLGWLEAHLGAQAHRMVAGVGSGPFMSGRERSIADFAVAHSLWFVRLAPALATVLDGYPAVAHWLDVMLALGHGHPTRMGSDEALQVAAAASAAGQYAPVEVQPGLGFEAGEPVSMTPTDYGCDPSTGVLVGLNGHRATIERPLGDPRLDGAPPWPDHVPRVHVHFPRLNYQIRKAPPP
jgi:glutathione S-transferase